jgi:hypothetical protein
MHSLNWTGASCCVRVNGVTGCRGFTVPLVTGVWREAHRSRSVGSNWRFPTHKLQLARNTVQQAGKPVATEVRVRPRRGVLVRRGDSDSWPRAVATHGGLPLLPGGALERHRSAARRHTDFAHQARRAGGGLHRARRRIEEVAAPRRTRNLATNPPCAPLPCYHVANAFRLILILGQPLLALRGLRRDERNSRVARSLLRIWTFVQ